MLIYTRARIFVGYRKIPVISTCVEVEWIAPLLFGFFCGCRGFCHRTESDLFLFLFQVREKETDPIAL